ncbi:hypothetical protein BD626DRAFT_566182 [Schizophyllum amplum]|uniref:RING-type domain-containing protein n=1 Tax=Schizophyllum amplum TaxID=97359 RepID=A0A550CQS7_9AGAR|nr:hypothetical protein BD626DRAFT_566182 [Auriculariopsis ampla]
MDACYCALCDEYFCDQRERMYHIQRSADHPRCDDCDRRFLNKNVLRTHWAYSRGHNYCALCQMHFRSAAGLRVHIEKAPVHCDDSDEELDGTQQGDWSDGWEDRLGWDLYPDERPEEEDGDGGDHSWEHLDQFDMLDLGEADEEHGNGGGKEGDGDGESGEDGYAKVVEFECPVCRQKPDVVCATKCGHLFCATCIHQSFKRDAECPICRLEGLPAQLRRVYLTVTDDY